jgi:hypothetical protein
MTPCSRRQDATTRVITLLVTLPYQSVAGDTSAIWTNLGSASHSAISIVVGPRIRHGGSVAHPHVSACATLVCPGRQALVGGPHERALVWAFLTTSLDNTWAKPDSLAPWRGTFLL